MTYLVGADEGACSLSDTCPDSLGAGGEGRGEEAVIALRLLGSLAFACQRTGAVCSFGLSTPSTLLSSGASGCCILEVGFSCRPLPDVLALRGGSSISSHWPSSLM